MYPEISNCLCVLNQGGAILYPTDTIWGIGCDATNCEAVEKVVRLKKRLDSKGLIVLLDDEKKLPEYVSVVPEIAWDILKNVVTPLTIIYPDAKNLATNVIAKDHSIAIRIVKDEFCSELIRAFGKPIVSTSANISGSNPPCTFKNIAPEIIEGVDYVVMASARQLHEIKASQIIKININGEFTIIRK